MKTTLLRPFVVALILFAAVPLCFADNPWSGYWWPLSRGELLLGYSSQISPLQKYDLAAYGYYPGPAYHESEAKKLNYDPGAPSWFGLCNGWAAAAIMEPEPTQPINVAGVPFQVGDQKGLLTEIWYNTSGDGWFKGNRYDVGDDPAAFEDLYPGQVLALLTTYIKPGGTPIVFDLAANEQVWNYPIYAYKYECTPSSNGWYNCALTITAADDAVRPDFVGKQTVTRYYTFSVQGTPDGKYIMLDTAYWTESSVSDHPDFAWYPGSQPVVRNSSIRYRLW